MYVLFELNKTVSNYILSFDLLIIAPDKNRHSFMGEEEMFFLAVINSDN